MAEVPREQRVAADSLMARSPLLLNYLADVMAAGETDDAGIMVELPAGLPLDEATLIALLFITFTFADDAGYDAAAVRAMADAALAENASAGQ